MDHLRHRILVHDHLRLRYSRGYCSRPSPTNNERPRHRSVTDQPSPYGILHPHRAVGMPQLFLPPSSIQLSEVDVP